MKHRIVLAHAADTKALAEITARRLAGLNIEVERRLIDAAAGDAVAGAARDFDRMILIWSRAAAGAEALLRRGDIADRLWVARLAMAPTPPRLKAPVVTIPRPNDSDDAWRALAGLLPQPATSARHAQKVSKPRRPESPHSPDQHAPDQHAGVRWHALLVIALMGAITAAAAYCVDITFAAAINAMLGLQ